MRQASVAIEDIHVFVQTKLRAHLASGTAGNDHSVLDECVWVYMYTYKQEKQS